MATTNGFGVKNNGYLKEQLIMNINILYLHGWGSAFNPTSDKMKALGKVGNVVGTNLDYTEPEGLIKQVKEAVIEHDIDLLVGTSMGGYLAAQCSEVLGIPFVACNPCHDPENMLRKYLGETVDYQGNTITLNEEKLQLYDKMTTKGAGLILCDLGDDVIDSKETIETYSPHYLSLTFNHGSHQFNHMYESVDYIKRFYAIVETVYG